MEERKITIKIGEYPYRLKAASAEHEEMIRKAADEINALIGDYARAFPDKTLRELVSLSAVNICISKMIAKQKVAELETELEGLGKEIESYLDNIDKDSR